MLCLTFLCRCWRNIFRRRTRWSDEQRVFFRQNSNLPSASAILVCNCFLCFFDLIPPFQAQVVGQPTPIAQLAWRDPVALLRAPPRLCYRNLKLNLPPWLQPAKRCRAATQTIFSVPIVSPLLKLIGIHFNILFSCFCFHNP